VIPTFIVIEGEVLNDFPRFFVTLRIKFATESVVNFAFKRIVNRINRKFGFEAKDVCYNKFSSSSRWEKQSKETGSEILPSGDGSLGPESMECTSVLHQLDGRDDTIAPSSSSIVLLTSTQYVVSTKEDTAYQRLDFTRKRAFSIPNTTYPSSFIRRIQLDRHSEI
ncbi:hypothetical protein Tco_0565283, partial [Tanacetum coccineum]